MEEPATRWPPTKNPEEPLFVLQSAETRWWSVAMRWVLEMLSDPKGAADTVPLWFYLPVLALGLLVAGVLAALGARIVARIIRERARDAEDRRQADATKTSEVTRSDLVAWIIPKNVLSLVFQRWG